MSTIAGGIVAGFRDEPGVNRGVVWTAVGFGVALLVALILLIRRTLRQLKRPR